MWGWGGCGVRKTQKELESAEFVSVICTSGLPDVHAVLAAVIMTHEGCVLTSIMGSEWPRSQAVCATENNN